MKRQNKLKTYLTLTAGMGCAATTANGAVTFYGMNAKNDTNPDPAGINFGVTSKGYYKVDIDGTYDSLFGVDPTSGYTLFTRGTDLTVTNPYIYSSGLYSLGGYFNSGAQAGDGNYANISFDGDDGVYEAVGQFYFDGAGGGYLIAIATNDAPNQANALSISAGKAMIAAAVPEPSSLALLALGSAGLLARRRRKIA